MLNRFLIWLYWLVSAIPIKGYTTQPLITKSSIVLDVLSEIKTEMNCIPECVYDIGLFDNFLHGEIDTRFNNYGQIALLLNFYIQILGEQLNDPLIPKYIDNPNYTLSDTGKKSTRLYYFLTQDNKDVMVKTTLEEIQKQVEILSLLYTQIINHGEIDEYIAPYLERRMFNTLVEIRDYVVNVKTLGLIHEKTNDVAEYPKTSRSR